MLLDLNSKKFLFVLSFLAINIFTSHAQEWRDDILFFNKAGTDDKDYQNNFIVKAGADGCSYDPSRILYGFTVNGNGSSLANSRFFVIELNNPLNITVLTSNIYVEKEVNNTNYAISSASVGSINYPVTIFSTIKRRSLLGGTTTDVVKIGGVFDSNITVGDNWSDLTEENKTMLVRSTVGDLLNLVGGAAAYNKPAFTETSNIDDISITPITASTVIRSGDVFYITKANANGCAGYHRKKFQVTLAPGNTYYKDSDIDGYGDESMTIQALEQPDGYVAMGGDCDDNDKTINTGATELYDGKDNNCDGVIDEGFVPYYKDMDGDGYGDINDTEPEYFTADTVPRFKSLNNLDCDDSTGDISPDAEEKYDGKDNNCDGVIDEGFVAYYKDMDGDGYGDINDTEPGYFTAETAPTDRSLNNLDCDDSTKLISPDAEEVHDGVDNNCDGIIDEDYQAYYIDSDGDTYGDINDTDPKFFTAETAPNDRSLNNLDCDDSTKLINPEITEIPNNGVDENCDGLGARTNIYRTHATCTTGGKLRITTDLPNGTTLTLLTNGVNVASGNIVEGEFIFENLAAGAYILEGLELPVNLNIDNIDNQQ